MEESPAQTISWSFSEYEHRDRKLGWFFIAGAVAVGLFTFAIFTSNFLFAGIIVFIAAVYALQHYHKPLTVHVVLSPDGITLQERLFPWKEIKTFWIIYEPPDVKNLYFECKGLRPRLKIPLHDQNPVAVREALLPYLDEDLEKENEPLSDAVGRVFKL
jgi:hypothetical protein